MSWLDLVFLPSLVATAIVRSFPSLLSDGRCKGGSCFLSFLFSIVSREIGQTRCHGGYIALFHPSSSPLSSIASLPFAGLGVLHSIYFRRSPNGRCRSLVNLQIQAFHGQCLSRASLPIRPRLTASSPFRLVSGIHLTYAPTTSQPASSTPQPMSFCTLLLTNPVVGQLRGQT